MKKSPRFIHFALLFGFSLTQVHAAVVTKGAAGTDLTDGASWAGTAPTAADIATWGVTSLGPALTVGSAVSWGSINITGATADIGITGAGTITTGNITLTGNRTLSIANAIALSANSAYNIADATASTAADTTLSGAISGAFSLTKSGAGTLVLSSTGNSFSGGTTISAGILSVSNISLTAAGQLGTSGTITLNGGTLQYTGGSVTTTRAFSAATATSSIEVTSAVTDLNLSGAISTGSSITVTKRGAGTLTLSGAANNSQPTFNVATGTLVLGKTSAAGVCSVVAIGDIATGATLQLSGTGGNQIYAQAGGFGNVTMSGGTFDLNARSESIGRLIGSGTITSSTAGTSTLTIGESASAASTFSGTIQNGSGTVALTKLGAYTETFSGANTYSGPTIVNAGILKAGIASVGGTSGAFGNGSAVTLANTAGVSVDITGFNTDIGSLAGGGAAGGNVTLGAATLTTGRNNTSTSYAGVISGTGGLTKIGSGTQTLNGANTFTGTTTITAGTLALGATGSINGSSANVSLGTVGTFDVVAKGGYTVSSLSGSGNVVGALTVSSTLAIGNSPGTVNFSDDLTLAALSTYAYEVDGGGSTADLANVEDQLTITGSILDLIQLGTYTVGDKFTLFSYNIGKLTGTFSGLTDDTTFLDGTDQWLINYDDTIAGLNGGTESRFVTITAVPEPAAALLGGLGLLALLRRRRSN